MEVFIQYFRRLLQNNASQIFASTARPGDAASGTYQLLSNEVQKMNGDVDQAQKIADSLDVNDGDPLKDFDLATFMDHFRLDPIVKMTLALCCKTLAKPDLKVKGKSLFPSKF